MQAMIKMKGHRCSGIRSQSSQTSSDLVRYVSDADDKELWRLSSICIVWRSTFIKLNTTLTRRCPQQSCTDPSDQVSCKPSSHHYIIWHYKFYFAWLGKRSLIWLLSKRTVFGPVLRNPLLILSFFLTFFVPSGLLSQEARRTRFLKLGEASCSSWWSELFFEELEQWCFALRAFALKYLVVVRMYVTSALRAQTFANAKFLFINVGASHSGASGFRKRFHASKDNTTEEERNSMI